MDLNYYAINRTLGGQMVAGDHARFGNLGLLSTLSEGLRSRPSRPAVVRFTYEMDSKIVEAFEEVRGGAAPERILIDMNVATRFYNGCRRRGVLAPDALLGRRLIGIRKNPKLYARHGIRLSPTTTTDPKPSIVHEHAHTVEFALVHLRYRYGVSIDDILLDQALAEEYETIARRLGGDLPSADLRLAALYIRKTRHIEKRDLSLFHELQAKELESNLTDLGSLDRVGTNAVPSEHGLIEIREKERPLYVSEARNLRNIAEQIVHGHSIEAMGNPFWKPRLDAIHLLVYIGQSFKAASMHKWQIKLIADLRPVLNWPVVDRVA